MARLVSSPSLPGIWISMRTASKPRGWALSRSRACWPPSRRVARAPSIPSRRSITRRLVGLSSTTRSRNPASRPPTGARGPGAGSGIAGGRLARLKGSSNQKVLPSPTRLSTPIRPPSNSTSSLLMERPRPVPPKRRLMLLSAWVKGEKRPAWASGVMPMPGSLTSKRSRAVAASLARGMTRTSISPWSVNLMALPIRLTSTCSRRRGSPSRSPSRAGRGARRRVRPLPRAVVPSRCST